MNDNEELLFEYENNFTIPENYSRFTCRSFEMHMTQVTDCGRYCQHHLVMNVETFHLSFVPENDELPPDDAQCIFLHQSDVMTIVHIVTLVGIFGFCCFLLWPPVLDFFGLDTDN
ncbi:hypothetical protein RF11_10856 [Thelohanellus kitauei]|uniref:Uncharacterized protein n=1 Tax=Thelohanellus kitauei TaxID=669202 RepID=A0A0C2MUD5_THEKT|nr:hypothetical protein RF11_10856 [Thelohanellus kitauei]